MIVNESNYLTLAWEKMDGLIPAIVQDKRSGEILMQGYMNDEALRQSLLSQKATFYSRSKQRLWMKGETSGNVINVLNILSDCDKDSLLIIASPQGPACHLGTSTCFPEQDLARQNFLIQLESIIAQRSTESIDKSYTAKLLSKGTARVAQKVGEEGVEVALAAATNQKEEFIGECADLFYHTLVLLKDQGVSLNTVMDELINRHNK